MNPVLANSPDASFAYKDAVYFSGHKFVGGPGLSFRIYVLSYLT
jgi:selenocysteine lyase/cysteine desulfurase